ncbi:MAG: hypothetical protein AAB483_01080 [Patescibacteria group bacterium]
MRWYVVSLISTALAAGIGLVLIILNTTPDSAGNGIKALFFVTLILTVGSIIALIINSLYAHFYHH